MTTFPKNEGEARLMGCLHDGTCAVTATAPSEMLVRISRAQMADLIQRGFVLERLEGGIYTMSGGGR